MKTLSLAFCLSALPLVLTACGAEAPETSAVAPVSESLPVVESPEDDPRVTLEESAGDSEPLERSPEELFSTERVREQVQDREWFPARGLTSLETEAPRAAVELSWRDCGVTGERQVRCAELQVPVDHSDPDGEKILIALNRISPAPGQELRGAILYNPGGPGGSGKSSARTLAGRGMFDEIAPGFEIIGFDPRGIGDSSALRCSFVDEYFAGRIGRPATEDDLANAVSENGLEDVTADLQWLSGLCRDYWGALFDKMGSNQVVQDIELIRQALGGDPLNFLGMSYGTRLGALYAQEFPQHVRAIVLDAAIPPEADFVRQVQGQVEQLSILHETVLLDCESGVMDCPEGARELFEQMLLDAEPLGLRPSVLAMWRLGLAYSFGRSYLPYLLRLQATEPNTDWMYYERAILEGDDASFVQNYNVNCADTAVELMSLAEADTYLTSAIERSPLFGRGATPMVGCNGWEVEPDPVPYLTAPDAPPLLIVGGTQDQRTPYVWSQELAESIESSVLLTSEHWGHTIVGDASECVNGLVRDYFTDLVLPEAGTICPE